MLHLRVFRERIRDTPEWRVAMKIGFRARRAVIRWLGALIIACVALAGCAVGPFGAAPTPGPAASLRLPGVTEVASVYAFRLRHYSLDEILIGSALLPDEAGALRPYLILRPDGSDLHRILTNQPCFLPHIYGSAFFSPTDSGSSARARALTTPSG